MTEHTAISARVAITGALDTPGARLSLLFVLLLGLPACTPPPQNGFPVAILQDGQSQEQPSGGPSAQSRTQAPVIVDSNVVERPADTTPVLTVKDATRTLFDFELLPDFQPWQATPGSRFERSDEMASSGRRSMLVRLEPGRDYPGVSLTTPSGRFHNWSGYEYLKFDIYNPSKDSFTLNLRADDDMSVNYVSRLGTKFGIHPGWGTYKVTMQTARTVDETRSFNWGKVKQLSFFVSENDAPLEFRMDNIRLEERVKTTILTDNLYLFDFGGDDSVAWPGFTHVSAHDIYDEKKHYGFAADSQLDATASDYPDELTGDFVSPAKAALPAEFVIDVPNGIYAVAVWGRNRHTFGHPARTWEIRAEGRIARRSVMSASLFYSEDYFYRGIDDLYRPGQDVWQTHVQPLMPREEFFVDVRDGQLDLSFSSLAVAAAVVCREQDEPRVRHFIAQVEESRRKEFYERFCRIQQAGFPGWPVELSDEDQRRGYVAFAHNYLHPVMPALAPRLEDLAPELRLNACAGEYEPAAFCIRPIVDLGGCTVAASDLHGEMGTIRAGAIDVRLLRNVLTNEVPGVYRARGRLLEHRQQIDLPRDVTQGFWLTVRVPNDAAPGLYGGAVTFTAKDRPSIELPIKLRVYPFGLPAPDDMSFGLYYSGPLRNNQLFAMFPERIAEAWDTIDQELADIAAHGLNTIELPEPRFAFSNGRLQVDFQMLDRFLPLCRERGLCTAQPGVVRTWEIANAQIREGTAQFSPEFNRQYQRGIAALRDWSQFKRLPLVMWVIDEPREEMPDKWNRNFAQSVRLLDLCREVPEVRTAVTILFDKHRNVDYTPMVDHLDVLMTKGQATSARNIARAKEQNKPVWLFNANFSRASWGFLPWAMRVDGRWQWHYQWWPEPFVYSPFCKGQGLTYPSPDGPTPTVEFEWLREGIDDYRYIKRLEQAIAAARGSGTDVAAAQALLDGIRNSMPDYVPSPGDRTLFSNKMRTQLGEWRRQIADQIIKLEEE